MRFDGSSGLGLALAAERHPGVALPVLLARNLQEPVLAGPAAERELSRSMGALVLTTLGMAK